MPSRVRCFSALSFLALACSFPAARPAGAQFSLGNIGPSKGQVVAAATGAGVGLAAIGVGIYFATRAPRLTGCLESSSGGLELQGSSPDQLFLLTGQTNGLAAGQRVKVLGKKLKAKAGPHTFLVKSLLKNYGACTATTKAAGLDPAPLPSAAPVPVTASLSPARFAPAPLM